MNILLCDTSALINNSNYIFQTNDTVIIHSLVLEELDSKAEKSSTNGKNARDVINGLFFLWKRGNLLNGVKNENNGIVKFDFRTPKGETPYGYRVDKHDNVLLSLLIELEEENKDDKVILVTGDRGLCLKASEHEVCYLPHENNSSCNAVDKRVKQWKKNTIKRKSKK